MVTSTSLATDASPAVNQQPVVSASVVDASSSSNNTRSTTVAARASLPSLIASSQSLPSTIVSSQMTSNESGGSRVVSPQVLPSYRQASHSRETTSVSPRPQSPSHPSQRPLNASLPDILHSHLGPSLRQNQHRPNRQRPRSHDPTGEGGVSSSRAGPHGGRHRSRGGDRGNRRMRTTSTSSNQTQEGGSCKEPCVKCVVTVTSFRWVLVLLSILGVCCVVSGIILAALHAVGNSFLFLAIMFIGLGVLLVVVVAVGWKCTPRGHEPLHALFRIGQFQNRRSRERRHRRHRNRDGNWFGGVLYPEFQYRRPPPSYAASMQDYTNQSLQELRTSGALSSGNIDSSSLPSSPPPSYRSRTSTMHSGIHSNIPGGQTSDLPNSRPPTYRSRAPSRRPSLPREERQELDQGADQAPADVAFTEPLSSEGNENPASSSAVFTVSSPSSSSTAPRSAPVATYSSSSLPSTSQTRIVNTDSAQTSASVSVEAVQLQDIPSHQSQNVGQALTGDASNNLGAAAYDSSSHPPQIQEPTISSSSDVLPSSSSQIPLPSLHQRMKSQDREMLEKALQSLDSQIHMEEDGGHVNLGATFNEPERFDTHL